MTLTARELEVLSLLAQGCTYSEAGRKLDVHSARAAVWRAMQLKLLAMFPS